jgi:hypothetical protein
LRGQFNLSKLPECRRKLPSRTGLATAHMRAAHQLHMVLRSRFAEDRLAAAVGRARRLAAPGNLVFTAYVFSWLGVTRYLQTAAIDAVLRSVAEFPEGSEIVLTFASASDTPRPIAQRAAHIGEPWLSFFEPAEMRDKLLATGFTTVEPLTPAVAQERYFHGSSLPTPRAHDDRRSCALGLKGGRSRHSSQQTRCRYRDRRAAGSLAAARATTGPR